MRDFGSAYGLFAIVRHKLPGRDLSHEINEIISCRMLYNVSETLEHLEAGDLHVADQ